MRIEQNIIKYMAFLLCLLPLADYCLKSIDVKVIQEQKLIKSPIGMSDGDFLWKLLDESALDKPLSEKKILRYAATVKKLIAKNVGISNTGFDALYPATYALYNCYWQISAVIGDDLRSRGFGATVYKPRAKEQRKADEKWAEDFASTLAGIVSKVINKGENNLEVQYENVTAECDFGKKFDVKVQVFFPQKYKINLHTRVSTNVYIFPPNSNFAEFSWLGRITFESSDICNKKLFVKVGMLTVDKNCRQGSLGRVLLSTAIKVGTLLGKGLALPKVHFRLEASPIDQSFLSLLIDYYKKFGFLPEDNKGCDNHLSMYIDMHDDKVKVLSEHEIQWTDWEKGYLVGFEGDYKAFMKKPIDVKQLYESGLFSKPTN